MAKYDFIDEIINDLDPEDIPIEYIVVAYIQTYSGSELTLSGKDLEAYMRLNGDSIVTFKFVLNMERIKSDINDVVIWLKENAF